MLALLDAWTERGWLRRIDRALVRWLQQLAPLNELTQLAVALCSHQYGRGHICLDLAATLADADASLSLPPEGDPGEAMPQRPSQRLAGVSLTQWLEALTDSHCLSGANSPLVLAGHRLYLRRNFTFEQQVAAHIRQRLVPQATSHTLAQQLAQLFPGDGVDWQKLACAVASRQRFAIITGGPGTGKTTTVVRLLGLLQQAASPRLRIGLAAPTGKAAARLTESIAGAVNRLQINDEVKASIPTDVSTLHKLLGVIPNSRHFRHHHQNPLHLDVLVVDEASMVDLEMMHALLDALPPEAKLILLGDKDQLASVEAGSVLGDLCNGAEAGGYNAETLAWFEALSGAPVSEVSPGRQALAQCRVMLRHSHRFGAQSGIGQLARAVNRGDAETALRLFDCDDLSRLPPEQLLPLASRGYRHYLQVMQQRRQADLDSWASAVLTAFGQFQVLCALRQGNYGVTGLNEQIAEALAAEKLISQAHGWYEGRPVLVTRNNYTLELMNGDVGICLHDGERLRVAFVTAGGIKWVLPSRLTDVETVYAMTVHKSQGSEFAHAVLVLPDSLSPVLTRELIYTGITRAREHFTLVPGALSVLKPAIARKVERASGLLSALQAEP